MTTETEWTPERQKRFAQLLAPILRRGGRAAAMTAAINGEIDSPELALWREVGELFRVFVSSIDRQAVQ